MHTCDCLAKYVCSSKIGTVECDETLELVKKILLCTTTPVQNACAFLCQILLRVTKLVMFGGGLIQTVQRTSTFARSVHVVRNVNGF